MSFETSFLTEEENKSNQIHITTMRQIVFFLAFSFVQYHHVILSCVPSSSQCGCLYEEPFLSKSKIIGGHTVEEHSWPWVGKCFYSIKLLLNCLLKNIS